MAALTIREVASTDVVEIRTLLGELGYDTEVETIAGKVEEYASSKESLALVAQADGGKLDGVIAGHLIPLFHERGFLGRITALIVAEKSRRKGTGTALLRELEGWFRDMGCVRVEITSGDHRQIAHEFYKRSGFEPSSRRFLKRYAI